VEPDHHYESNPESEVRFEVESNLEASQVTTTDILFKLTKSSMYYHVDLASQRTHREHI